MKTQRYKVTITERGWPGHFICGTRCVFHRNTLLQTTKQSIIVSTVGRMIDYHAPGFPTCERYDIIGYQRWGETMIFEAEFRNDYWEIDVTKEVSSATPWCIDRPPDETFDAQADKMHDDTVAWLSAVLKREGELKNEPNPR